MTSSKPKRFGRDDKARAFDKSNAFIIPLSMQNCYHSGMNFRHLRAFETIADIGGFARAAARLNLSQPALSRQIHALEAELGVPLFDRIGRRVQLTSEGEDLLRRSRRLLTEVELFGERARALKTGQTGVLRVGTTPQAIESLLVAFCPATRHGIPASRCISSRTAGRACQADWSVARFTYRSWQQVKTRSRPVAVSDVPAGRDAGRPPPESPRARSNHRARGRAAVAAGRGFASREWFYAACQVAQIRPHVLLESAAPQTLIALAGHGYGIAFVPSMVPIPRETVRAVPVLQRRAPIGRWMTSHGIRSDSWLPTQSSSSTRSWPFGATIQAVSSLGAPRHCPGRNA